MSNYIVSGAGSTAFNGSYVPQGVDSNGNLYYKSANGSLLQYATTPFARWQLTGGGSGEAYYSTDGTPSMVPTTGWTCSFGEPPVPTVAVTIPPADSGKVTLSLPNGGNVRVPPGQTRSTTVRATAEVTSTGGPVGEIAAPPTWLAIADQPETITLSSIGDSQLIDIQFHAAIDAAVGLILHALRLGRRR